METLKLIGVLVLGVAVGVFGVLFFTHRSSGMAGASPVGSTFGLAQVAAITVAPNTGSATTTSLLNNSGSNRYITGVRLGCSNVGTSQTAYTGAGLANWTISAGTTTTSDPAVPSYSLELLNAFNLSTSSNTIVVASSTTQVGSQFSALWSTGQYLTFSFNATNTAVCTVGVDYLGS